MRSSAWTLVCISLLLGCEPEAGAPRRRLPPPPPPPRVPARLEGTYRVWIGRPSADGYAPGARWCFLDLTSDGGALQATAWRPGAAIRCVRAEYTAVRQVRLRLVRRPAADGEDGEDGAVEEAARSGRPPPGETWILCLRAAPKGEADAPDAPGPLRGTATVRRADGASRRSWTSGAAARPVDVDEDEEYQRWRAANRARQAARAARARPPLSGEAAEQASERGS